MVINSICSIYYEIMYAERSKKGFKFWRKNIEKSFKVFIWKMSGADLDLMTGVGRTHIMMAEAIVK